MAFDEREWLNVEGVLRELVEQSIAEGGETVIACPSMLLDRDIPTGPMRVALTQACRDVEHVERASVFKGADEHGRSWAVKLFDAR